MTGSRSSVYLSCTWIISNSDLLLCAFLPVVGRAISTEKPSM